MWYQTKHPNKYGATKHEYDGRVYHSKLEAAYAMALDLRIKAGDVQEWVPQFKVSLDVNGKHIANYFVDFKVILTDGSEELHEVKGFATEVYRLKRKLLEATYLVDHPDTKFIEVRG